MAAWLARRAAPLLVLAGALAAPMPSGAQTEDPPELQSATVNRASLVLEYGENLDLGSVPAASAFTVKVDGSAVSLASSNPVDVGNTAVTLTLASPVTDRHTVTVSYAVPSSNPIQDYRDNVSVAFSDWPVTNNTPDTSGPELHDTTMPSLDHTGGFLTIAFDEPLDRNNRPPASAFAVTAGGRDVTVTIGTIISAGTVGLVRLDLSPVIRSGWTVRVSYTDPSRAPAEP